MRRSRTGELLAGVLFALTGPLLTAVYSAEATKPIVVIFDVEKPKDMKSPNVGVLSDTITSEFSKSNEFSIVDRDTIYYHFKLVNEKKAGGCEEAECLADLAMELEAQYFIKSTVVQEGKGCRMDVKMYGREPGTEMFYVETAQSGVTRCANAEIVEITHQVCKKVLEEHSKALHQQDSKGRGKSEADDDKKIEIYKNLQRKTK